MATKHFVWKPGRRQRGRFAYGQDLDDCQRLWWAVSKKDIMRELGPLIDDGWEPMEPVGPQCWTHKIKRKSEFAQCNLFGKAMWIGAGLLSAGAMTAVGVLAGDRFYVADEFCVHLRR